MKITRYTIKIDQWKLFYDARFGPHDTRYTLHANHTHTIHTLHAHDSHVTRTRYTRYTLFWETFTLQGGISQTVNNAWSSFDKFLEINLYRMKKCECHYPIDSVPLTNVNHQETNFHFLVLNVILYLTMSPNCLAVRRLNNNYC